MWRGCGRGEEEHCCLGLGICWSWMHRLKLRACRSRRKSQSSGSRSIEGTGGVVTSRPAREKSTLGDAQRNATRVGHEARLAASGVNWLSQQSPTRTVRYNPMLHTVTWFRRHLKAAVLCSSHHFCGLFNLPTPTLSFFYHLALQSCSLTISLFSAIQYCVASIATIPR